ncbi:hypothetical protein BJV82DRAFT_616213 [Fennellomyces sp. T-0311]|nr:hypothetical protein BJV82DRAFT_616213 [Fennellomyces sp. T-0311]
MTRRSSYTQTTENRVNTTIKSRRVSFDLEHNVVHVLPSLEQCRQEASKRGREEWERKQFNQDMLNELIVAEIQLEYSAKNPEVEPEPVVLKSCLRKMVIAEQPALSHHKKKAKKSNGKKKSKRGHANKSLHHAAPGCTMEAQAYPVSMPLGLPIVH